MSSAARVCLLASWVPALDFDDLDVHFGARRRRHAVDLVEHRRQDGYTRHVLTHESQDRQVGLPVIDEHIGVGEEHSLSG